MCQTSSYLNAHNSWPQSGGRGIRPTPPPPLNPPWLHPCIIYRLDRQILHCNYVLIYSRLLQLFGHPRTVQQVNCWVYVHQFICTHTLWHTHWWIIPCSIISSGNSSVPHQISAKVTIIPCCCFQGIWKSTKFSAICIFVEEAHN